jgi:hypothetical protein
MNCGDLQRWLDEGAPAASADAAQAHALVCAACERALRVAIEIEGLLEAGPPPAPAGFSARVMERVQEAPRLALLAQVPALPWWLRAAAEPACALALVTAGLLTWHMDLLWWLAQAAAGWMRWVVPRAPSGNILGQWLPGASGLAGALAVALLPIAAVASWAIYRWMERAVALRTRRLGAARP